MKERPVIFNGEMVSAILDGRKTQTRRVVSDKHLHLIDIASQVGECYPLESGIDHDNSQSYYREHCPFGQVGDLLWVRETWGVVSHDFDENERIIDLVPDRPATAIHEMPFGNGYYSGHAIYSADGEFTWGDDDGHGEKSCWKPSIHMPRWASRITLEITGVRVERLQDISEADAIAEGVRAIENNFGNGPSYCDYLLPNLNDTAEWYNRASDSFKSLWKSIYGAESWNANPWVWVIEFRRVEAQHG
ncbi:ASCH domain-containing protein [Serratia proteamaculans]|uniref:hypothetical protein n=1 Tax=Serratia proteamaculans TaxID=28151 RepID=UPI00217964CD|nr:hypothetical protein [Serratia proteamaculans]CAI1178934.1 Uncharacterised protein [Serratia proteamaculans]